MGDLVRRPRADASVCGSRGEVQRWKWQCQKLGSLSDGTETLHKTPLCSGLLSQIHPAPGGYRERTDHLDPYGWIHANVSFGTSKITLLYLKVQYQLPGPALLILRHSDCILKDTTNTWCGFRDPCILTCWL